MEDFVQDEMLNALAGNDAVELAVLRLQEGFREFNPGMQDSVRPGPNHSNL